MVYAGMDLMMKLEMLHVDSLDICGPVMFIQSKLNCVLIYLYKFSREWMTEIQGLFSRSFINNPCAPYAL